MPSSNVSLSVYASEITYSATVSAGDSGISSTSGSGWYAEGASVSASASCATGYHFSRWTGYVSSTLSTISFIMPDENVTITAFSEPNIYTITYNDNGSTSGSTSSSSHTYNVSKSLTQNGYTKTGYTFLGWSTSSTATSATYTDGQSVSNLSTTHNDTVTLYAVWKANTYTINYDANGGSGAPDSQTKTHDVPLTLSTTIPTYEGYTFLGWSTSSSATEVEYSAGGSYTTNATTTLYAVWSKSSDGSIKVYDDNGNLKSGKTYYYNADGNLCNVLVYIYDSNGDLKSII